MGNNIEFNELVESAASYAGNLYNGLEKIVNNLREDNVRTGLSMFADATEGIDWLIQAASIISNSDYDKFDIEPMKGHFAEMNESAENMDYVLLTDLIEYEMLPIVEDWGDRLDVILDRIKEED